MSIDDAGGGADSSRFALDDRSVVSSEIARLLQASGEEDFFGLPIGTGNVGIVIDDRDRLDGHADQVARLAYAANDFAKSNNAEIRLVEARWGDVGADDRATDPYYALPVLRVPTLMAPSDPENQETKRLSSAFALTARAVPQQVFVVISEPLQLAEKELLESEIRAAGVPVHMICLGDAASDSCKELAAMSGGRFIPVSDQAIVDLVDRCDVVMPARAR